MTNGFRGLLVGGGEPIYVKLKEVEKLRSDTLSICYAIELVNAHICHKNVMKESIYEHLCFDRNDPYAYIYHEREGSNNRICHAIEGSMSL